MTIFLTSTEFVLLLAVAAVVILATTVWLMRDGPTARSRRGGMVDLVGAKPTGIAWDWPSAPGVVTGELTLPEGVTEAERQRFHDEFRGTGVRIIEPAQCTDGALPIRLRAAANRYAGAMRAYEPTFIEPRDLEAERRIRSWTDDHPPPDRRPSFGV